MSSEQTKGADGVDNTEADRNIQIWKVKKLIKSLEAARGYALKPFFPFFVWISLLFLSLLLTARAMPAVTAPA